MKRRHLPAFSSLMLTGIFVAIWLYAFFTTTNSPVWFPHLMSLAILSLSLIGAGAAAQSESSISAKSFYVIGILLIIIGVGSFYVFNAPTTINIFGFLCIVVGVIDSLISSVFIAFPYDKKTI